MSPVDWSGQWVLVTGASSGIGRQFAVELARRGANLVLCSRNRQRLEQLADELNTETRVIATDLETAEGVAQLLQQVDALDIRIDHVVNNAGMGGAGHFARQDPAHQVNLTALNCTSVVRITRHFLPQFIEREGGGFIQIASTASFQPVPYMAVYGATKAYVLSFSVAVAQEIEGSGVRMTVLCPGPVQTGFQARAGYELTGIQKKNKMSVEDVVNSGLAAYDKDRRVCIPGTTNSLQTFAQRFFPLSVVTKAAATVMKRSGRDKL